MEKLLGDDARAVELLGGVVNDGVLSRLSQSSSQGEVLVESRTVRHPAYDDAVVRTPTLVGIDASDAKVYETECFGPVSYLIRTPGTEESIDLFRSTVRAHGAMTASVYSTSEEVLGAMREAALDAGVALSENLTGQVFVNQTAAFSDFHGTGANPAATAAYTDTAYVANRFRIITFRRHL
jgi:acyl-CoA reductase-like NAD-dependent aldehyde dehydrogenase